MKTPPLFSFLAATLAFALLNPATAGTLRWGVAAQGAADFDLFSDGRIIGDGEFGYELGAFSTTFTPSPQNVGLWDANWQSISSSDFDSLTGNYGDEIDTSLIGSLPQGIQMFVWGSNSRTIGENLEWVLYTGEGAGSEATDSNWIATGADVDLVWQPQSANRAIVGRIATTDFSEVGGEISNSAVLGVNAIQAAAIVPEPGVSILLLTAGFSVFALRRGGRRTPVEGR